MKQRADKIPADVRDTRLGAALDRLVRLYEAIDKKDDAAKWRNERDKITKP